MRPTAFVSRLTPPRGSGSTSRRGTDSYPFTTPGSSKILCLMFNFEEAKARDADDEPRLEKDPGSGIDVDRRVFLSDVVIIVNKTSTGWLLSTMEHWVVQGCNSIPTRRPTTEITPELGHSNYSTKVIQIANKVPVDHHLARDGE